MSESHVMILARFLNYRDMVNNQKSINYNCGHSDASRAKIVLKGSYS